MKSSNLRVNSAHTVIAVLVLTAAIQVTCPDHADAAATGCVTVGDYRVCTTDPTTDADGRDPAVVNEMGRQIRGTAKGGTIRIAMYKFMLGGLAEDLVAANRRGVDVKAVVGTNDDHPDRNLKVIKTLRDGGVKVVVCKDSCLPNRDGNRRGAMHNKFLIIDGTHPTVTQTSSNLTTTQTEWYQSLVSVYGDEALYRYYLAYWNRLAAKSWTVGGDTWGNADRSGTGDDGRNRAYVFPVTTGDPLEAILEDVTDCRSGHDRVWLTHNIIERVAVRDRLIELRNAGCDVRVVTGKAEYVSFAQAHVRGLGHLDPKKVKRLRGTHNKFVVIDAKYAGKWRELVATGSHNMNANALKNANDVLLRVVDDRVADRFAGYFDRLYRAA